MLEIIHICAFVCQYLLVHDSYVFSGMIVCHVLQSISKLSRPSAGLTLQLLIESDFCLTALNNFVRR